MCCSSDLNPGTHRILQGKPPPKPAVPKNPKKDASRPGQSSSNPQPAIPVRFFLVMVELVTISHVLLGATSDQPISTFGREGPCSGAYDFP